MQTRKRPPPPPPQPLKKCVLPVSTWDPVLQERSPRNRISSLWCQNSPGDPCGEMPPPPPTCAAGPGPRGPSAHTKVALGAPAGPTCGGPRPGRDTLHPASDVRQLVRDAHPSSRASRPYMWTSDGGQTPNQARVPEKPSGALPCSHPAPTTPPTPEQRAVRAWGRRVPGLASTSRVQSRNTRPQADTTPLGSDAQPE